MRRVVPNGLKTAHSAEDSAVEEFWLVVGVGMPTKPPVMAVRQGCYKCVAPLSSIASVRDADDYAEQDSLHLSTVHRPRAQALRPPRKPFSTSLRHGEWPGERGASRVRRPGWVASVSGSWRSPRSRRPPCSRGCYSGTRSTPGETYPSATPPLQQTHVSSSVRA